MFAIRLMQSGAQLLGWLVWMGLWIAGCAGQAGAVHDSAHTPQPSHATGQGAAFGVFSVLPSAVNPRCDARAELVPEPLRRLSSREYLNTIRDLLAPYGGASAFPGVQEALARLPEDSLGDTFRTLDTRLSIEHVSSYLDVSFAVGNAIVDNTALLSKLIGARCAVLTPLPPMCLGEFADGFARRAFRRPLTTAERRALAELDDRTRSAREAVRAMAVFTLSSPVFLNHVENMGDPLTTDVLRLSSYEVASRLAYTFWRTMPDEELLASAEDGSLLQPRAFARQLQRVFADPRTRETLWTFWYEWLRLERFTGFENWRPGVRALSRGASIEGPGPTLYTDMVSEIRLLTDLYTFKVRAPLSELLTTRESVTTSEALAHLYGVEPYRGHGPFPLLPAGTRAGLLQRSALLVSSLETTNPFHRGAYVRRTLLCDVLKQPDSTQLPPGALDPPDFDPTLSTRARYASKVAGNPLCASCHDGFSDLGYMLEAFDPFGRYRTTEQVFDARDGRLLATIPLDLRGVPRIDARDEREVVGPAELNARIVASGQMEVCLAKRYVAYQRRRLPQRHERDHCVATDLARRLEGGEPLDSVFRGIAAYPSFFVHKVGAQ